MRTLTTFLLCLLLAVPLCAQKNKRDPLTPVEQDQIAEAGISPVDRLNLYVKFINQHADTIQGLIKRAHSAARVHRMDDELQDFTALMDELGSNLDVYSERKADIRKALKPLNEATERWLGVLRALADEPGFELTRKEALESGEDLTAQTKRLLAEQTEYFKLHKDEQGQQRAEPK